MRALIPTLLLLSACGGSQDGYVCPVVTPQNVHLMTGDLPPGHPCTQDVRETVQACTQPLEGPTQPCPWDDKP